MKTRSCSWGFALIVELCGAQTPSTPASGPAIEINHCAGGPPITMSIADRRALLDDDERESLLAEMRARYPILARDDFSAPEILLWRKRPDEWLYVSLRPDGTFTVRFRLPDSRQVIPCVATSPDGGEERLIVLAIERNTRRMDPAPANLDD